MARGSLALSGGAGPQNKAKRCPEGSPPSSPGGLEAAQCLERFTVHSFPGKVPGHRWGPGLQVPCSTAELSHPLRSLSPLSFLCFPGEGLGDAALAPRGGL